MPGPIYTAGRTPLTSAIGSAGGSIQGPSQPGYKKLYSSLKTQPVLSGPRVAPTMVQDASGSTGAATSFTTITPTLGSAVVAGNRIILVIDSDATFTTPQGTWTQLASVVQNQQFSVWTRVATGGETNWGTITIGGSSAWWVSEWSNVDPTQPDVTTLVQTQAATAISYDTPTSATSTIPETAAIAVWGLSASGVNPPNVTAASNSFTLATHGAAETSKASGTNIGISAWTKTNSATAAFVSTGTIEVTIAAAPASGIIVLRGAISAGGPSDVDSGVIALTGQTSLTTAGSDTVLAASTMTSDLSLSVTGNPVKLGTTALTGETSLTVNGSNTVLAISALSGQTTLVSAGLAKALATSNLTSDTTLVTNALVKTTGVSALSGQTSLTTVGSNKVLAVATMTSDLSLVVSGTVTGTATIATLTGQSTLTVSGLVKTTGVSALSGQTSLTTVGANKVFAISGMTSDSVLVTNALVKTTGAVSLNGELTLTASGIIGATPSTAFLSAQTSLTIAGSNKTFGISALTGQTTLTTVGANKTFGIVVLTGQSTLVSSGLAKTTGAVAMTGQSTLIASGTVGATPASALLTGQSSLTVSGSVTAVAQANLIQSLNYTGDARVSTRGVANLSSTVDITAIGTRKQFAGTITLTAQSILTASGFIPAIITGQAILSVLSVLTADGDPTPPWVFEYIEFSQVKVIGRDGDSGAISGESGTSKSKSYEGKTTIIIMEGG